MDACGRRERDFRGERGGEKREKRDGIGDRLFIGEEREKKMRDYSFFSFEFFSRYILFLS